MDTEIKIKIINHLIRIKEYGILRSNSIPNQLNRSLVSENDELIVTLLGLSEENKLDLIDVNEGESFNNNKNNEQFAKRLQDIENKMAHLQSNLDVSRSEATFAYVLKDVDQFFMGNNYVLSPMFFCQGFPFAILVINERGYINLSLHLFNNIVKKNWSISVDYEFTLVSQSSSIVNKVTSSSRIFTRDDKFTGTYVPDTDMSINVLRNGFIKNNQIEIRVKVKAESLQIDLINCSLD